MNKLILRGQQNLQQARSVLSAQQIAFAEYLALPPSKRKPLYQKDFAKEIGVTEQSLCGWKNIPELWIVRDEVMGNQARELVAKAQGILDKAMDSRNEKIKLEAAKDVMDRFGESRKHGTIIADLRDLYKQYHEEG
jgi:hypothetical protein